MDKLTDGQTGISTRIIEIKKLKLSQMYTDNEKIES